MADPSSAPSRPAPPRRRGARYPLALALLGVTVLVGGLLVAAAVGRRSVAAHLIELGFESAGIELGAVGVEAIEPTHLIVRDLQIARPFDLSVRRLEARYSWASLRDRRVDSIDVQGVRLRAALPASVSEAQPGAHESSPASPVRASATPDHWDPGPLAATLASIPTLPARRIDLADLRIELTSAQSSYEIGGELHAMRTDGELEASTHLAIEGPAAPSAGVLLRQPIDIELQLEAKPDGLRAALAPSAVRIAVEADEPLLIDAVTPAVSVSVSLAEAPTAARVEVESEGGRVSSPTFELEASGFSLRAAYAAMDLPSCVELRVANVRDLRRPARFPALALVANLELAGHRRAFQLALRDQRDRILLQIRGHHETARDRGSAEIHLLPITFARDGLQPMDLLRPLAGSISNVSGTVEALGSASFSRLAGVGGAPRELHTSVDLALRDVSLETPVSTLQAINGSVRVDGPWPPSTPPGQILQVGLIDVGVPLTDAIVSFQLHEDLSVTLEEAVLHFAGGTLRTAGRLDLAAPAQELTFEVSGLELDALFDLVAVEGLTGSGSLWGSIPILRTRDSIEIREGELSNQRSNRLGDGEQRTGGWIRYRPSAAVKAAAAGQSEFSIALDALENFHYEELDLQLSGDPNRGVDLSLHITGSNPDFRDGYPVNFNLNLEAPLGGLRQTVSYSRDLTDQVEQSLSSFSSRAANFRRAGASTGSGDPLAAPDPDR